MTGRMVVLVSDRSELPFECRRAVCGDDMRETHLRGDDRVPLPRSVQQLLDDGDDLTTAWNGEGAAGREEVVLHVDDDESGVWHIAGGFWAVVGGCGFVLVILGGCGRVGCGLIDRVESDERCAHSYLPLCI